LLPAPSSPPRRLSRRHPLRSCPRAGHSAPHAAAELRLAVVPAPRPVFPGLRRAVPGLQRAVPGLEAASHCDVRQPGPRLSRSRGTLPPRSAPAGSLPVRGRDGARPARGRSRDAPPGRRRGPGSAGGTARPAATPAPALLLQCPPERPGQQASPAPARSPVRARGGSCPCRPAPWVWRACSSRRSWRLVLARARPARCAAPAERVPAEGSRAWPWRRRLGFQRGCYRRSRRRPPRPAAAGGGVG
jgi:hypothetical protein